MKIYHLFLTLIMMAAVGLVCRSCRSVHQQMSLRDSTVVAEQHVHRDSFSVQSLAKLAKLSNQRIKLTMRDIRTSKDSTGNEVSETKEVIIESDTTERTDSTSMAKADSLNEISNKSSNVTVAEEDTQKEKEPPNRWPGIILLAIIALVVTYIKLDRHS